MGAARVAPVIVVLDLSGSMNDDDGTGLIKLTGAKRAVEGVVRSLPPSQPFGLWTYPGGTDECASGSFAIEPASITDVTATVATVDGQIADGGTPTGPALEGAAGAIRAQGGGPATLILVSDGESNCGTSPCDVAESLVQEGFDVTVHAVGFRVSDAGSQELSCVAAATGGTYVDVSDSGQLNETLRDLTRARLRVQTTSSPQLGGLVATVTNESGVTADDAYVHVRLTGGPRRSDALVRIGNVPPGRSVQRQWVFGLDPRSQKTTPFVVDAWAANADRVSVTGTLGSSQADSGLPLGDALGPVLRDPLEAGRPIAILGDSYSSGEGTFSYARPPQGVSPGCHRSRKTYLAGQLDADQVVILACSGAVRQDFYFSGRDGTPPQLEQLADLDESPGAVVMTLGGNDIGFAKKVEQCVRYSCDDDPRRARAWLSEADSLRAWLAPVYEDVWTTLNLPAARESRGGGWAPVLVLPYPQVTHATKFGACGRLLGAKDVFGAGEVRLANQLVAHLNAAIKAAVADARDDGYEVYFVRDVADAMLPDHTLCDGPEAYVNSVLLSLAPPGPKQESVHPNVSGYAVETRLIAAWSNGLTTVPPSKELRSSAIEEVTDVPWTLLPVSPANVNLQETVGASTLTGGGSVIVQGSGYAPGTPVTISVHSTPAVLGTLVADAEGAVSGTLHLPSTIELGRHELVASATSADGSFREERVPVTVVARPPLVVQLSAIGAALLVLVALGLAVMHRRTTRRTRQGTASS